MVFLNNTTVSFFSMKSFIEQWWLSCNLRHEPVLKLSRQQHLTEQWRWVGPEMARKGAIKFPTMLTLPFVPTIVIVNRHWFAFIIKWLEWVGWTNQIVFEIWQSEKMIFIGAYDMINHTEGDDDEFDENCTQVTPCDRLVSWKCPGCERNPRKRAIHPKTPRASLALERFPQFFCSNGNPTTIPPHRFKLSLIPQWLDDVQAGAQDDKWNSRFVQQCKPRQMPF